MKLALRLGILVALLLGTATLTFLNRDMFTSAPWQNEQNFHYPVAALSDLWNRVMVVDQSGRHLLALNEQGEMLWQMQGGKRQGGFYVLDLLANNGDMGVWASNTVNSQSSSNAERVEILPISWDGTIGAPAWQRITAENEQNDYQRIPYFMRIYKQTLVYFIGDADGNTLLHTVDLLTGVDTVVRTFPALDAYQYVNAVYDPIRRIGWFMDNSSQIWQWTDNQDLAELVFSNSPQGGKVIMVPSDLHPHANGGFLVVDGKSTITRINADGTWAPWYQAKRGELYLSGLRMLNDGRVAIANEQNHNLIFYDPLHPKDERVISKVRFSTYEQVRHYTAWGAAVLGIIIIIILIIVLYIHVMRRRTPLLFKQLGVFLPLVIGSVVAVSFWIYQDLMGRYEAEVKTRQLVWSQLGAAMIDASDIDALALGQQSQGQAMGTEAFSRLSATMARIVNDNQDPWNASTYVYIYTPAGQDWYVFDQSSYFERYLPKVPMLEVFTSGKPAIINYADAYSTWLSGFAPIKRADGSVAALLEVAIDQNIFSEITLNFEVGLAIGVGIALVILLGVTFLSTFWLLKSIHSLKRSATLLSQGNYDVQVKIKSRDEIEDLGAVFNQMSREIQASVARVIELKEANAKFVPSQFLTFLGKDSITEIRLGDQVQREMTVLFADIRAFTNLSERMTPEENFNFINRYLNEMGPMIRKQNGFIDKYIGDAIMALFPHSIEDGLRAALAMFSTLDRLNQKSGLNLNSDDDVHIGIGIHTGMLMLGIIGESERFDGTVISDAVNLASRLESLTKYYGAAILISGQALGRIHNPGFFESRLIDKVQVKGKTEAIALYEVLVPGHAGCASKLSHRAQFNQALESYFRGELSDARALFHAVASTCPDDQSINIYLRRMKTHLENPNHPWTGVTVLDSK